MTLDTAYYLVTRTVAVRSGLINNRYRTQDGRYILDNKDLSRVKLTSEEYISGLSGVERISESEATTLIAMGGYKKGSGVENPNNSIPSQEGSAAEEETLDEGTGEQADASEEAAADDSSEGENNNEE